jgi:2'-5' RNA ligase
VAQQPFTFTLDDIDPPAPAATEPLLFSLDDIDPPPVRSAVADGVLPLLSQPVGAPGRTDVRLGGDDSASRPGARLPARVGDVRLSTPRQSDLHVEVTAPMPEVPNPTWTERLVTDPLVTTAKGILGVGEAAVGLADIPTMGLVGGALEKGLGYDPELTRQVLDSFYSKKMQEGREEFAKADGLIESARAVLNHPNLLTHSVLESLPLMLAGGAVGRGLAATGRMTAATGAAVGEGAVGGGMAAESARQQGEGSILTPKDVAVAATSGAATSLLGRLGARIAEKLGIADVDSLIAGAAVDEQAQRALVKQVLYGAVSEGGLEELPQSVVEQVLDNAANNRPLDEGVPQAAVMGTLAGAVMGGGAQVVAQATRPTDPRPSPVPADASSPPGSAATGTPLPAPPASVGAPTVSRTVESRRRPASVTSPVIAPVESVVSTSYAPTLPPEFQPVTFTADEVDVSQGTSGRASLVERDEPLTGTVAERAARMRAENPRIDAEAAELRRRSNERRVVLPVPPRVPEAGPAVGEPLPRRDDAGVAENASPDRGGAQAGAVPVGEQQTPTLRETRPAAVRDVRRPEGTETPSGLQRSEASSVAVPSVPPSTSPTPVPIGEKPEGVSHKFSSTQLNLPPEIAGEIQQLAAFIPDEQLAEGGREQEPHITVKYGLTTTDAEAVARVLADQPPVRVTFGKTSHFADVEDGTADAIKVDVEGPELRALNAKIAEALDASGDTHPDYKPHATIAYVKPGIGKDYDGDTTLEGREVEIDRLVFSSKDGQKYEIPLQGVRDATQEGQQPESRETEHQDAQERGETAEASGRDSVVESREVEEIDRTAAPVVRGDITPHQAFMLRWIVQDFRAIPWQKGGSTPEMRRMAREQADPNDTTAKMNAARNGWIAAPHVAGAPLYHTLQTLGVTASRPAMANHIENYLNGKQPKEVSAVRAALKVLPVLEQAWNRETRRFDWSRVQPETLDTLNKGLPKGRRLNWKTLKGLVTPPPKGAASIRAPWVQRPSADQREMRRAFRERFRARRGERARQRAMAVEAERQAAPTSAVVDADGAPLVVYHGTGKAFAGVPKAPAFFTTEREGANWYAVNRPSGENAQGRILAATLDIRHPYDASDEQGARGLIALAQRAGVEVVVTESDRGWSMFSPEIAKHSPYDGENLLDLLYVPSVRAQLKREGFDGVFAFDVLENSEIPTWIPLDDQQIALQDVNEFGEQQPRLPGAGEVREVETATPEVADVPFSLAPEVAETSAVQPALGAVDETPAAEPWSTRALERVFGFSKDVAEGVDALARSMGLDLSKIKLARGGTPGDNALSQVDINSPEFKRWFGDSKVVDADGRPLVVYHGTGNTAGILDRGFSYEFADKGNDAFGSGFYFSTEERTGRRYTTARIDPEVPKLGGESSPGILQVYLSIQNPIKINATKSGNAIDQMPELTRSQVSKLIRLSPDIDNLDDGPLTNWGDVSYEGKATVLKKAIDAYVGGNGLALANDFYSGQIESFLNNYRDITGYDGVQVQFPSGEQHYIAWFPTQIKSAIANRGTFDPNDPDILRQERKRLSVVHNLSAENLIHADELGGLAVPSVAIVREDSSIEGFGNITLIGREELADPAREPVFDSDIYSMRHPKPEYPRKPWKAIAPIIDRVREFSNRFDEYSFGYEITEGTDPGESIRKLERSTAARAMFLQEKHGVTIEPVMVPQEVEYRWAADPEFLKAWWTFEEADADIDQQPEVYQAMADAARAAIDRHIAKMPASERNVLGRIKKDIREMLGSRWGNSGEWVTSRELPSYRVIEAIRKSVQNRDAMRVSDAETRERVNAKMTGREDEYLEWLNDLVRPLYGPPSIKVAGRKRAYTLNNIVDAMTSTRLKGREKTMAFGEGAARAQSAHRITSMTELRNRAEWQLTTEDQFEEVQAGSKAAVGAWRDAVLEYAKYRDTWSNLDGSMRALAKAWQKGMSVTSLRRALAAEDFVNVPQEVLEQGVAAAKLMMNTQVPYFEGKPQRAVRLSEFAGAVIPKSASQRVRQILINHGVPFREYDGNTQHGQRDTVIEYRRELAEQMPGVLFQSRVQSDDPAIRRLFQEAWHGSPWIFDAFTTAKIGTGEGAQAYGWGLYFAGNKEVAKFYRERLAGREDGERIEIDGTSIWDNEIGLYHVEWVREEDPNRPGGLSQWYPVTAPQSDRVKRGLLEIHGRIYDIRPSQTFDRVRSELEKTRANLERRLNAKKDDAAWYIENKDEREVAEYRLNQEVIPALEVLDRYGSVLKYRPAQKPGRLYKVDIPGDDEYLDWDKPLDQQPKNAAIFSSLGIAVKPVQWSAHQVTASDVKARLYPSAQEGQWIARSSDGGWGGGTFLTKDAAEKNVNARQGYVRKTPTGSDAYNALIYHIENAQGRYDVLAERYGVPGEVFGGAMGFSFGKSAPQMASQVLAAKGLAGIRYLDGSSRRQKWLVTSPSGMVRDFDTEAEAKDAQSRIPGSKITPPKGQHNYVVFDEQLVKIMEFEQGPKGAVEFFENGEAVIRAFGTADVSTALHELAHVARRTLLNREVPEQFRRGVTDADIQAVEDWATGGTGNWNRQAEEKFARGFERYLREGGPTTPGKLRGVFKKLATWMTEVYQQIAGSPIDVEITPRVRAVLDRLVTRQQREMEESKRAQPVKADDGVPGSERAHRDDGTFASNAEVNGYEKVADTLDAIESDAIRRLEQMLYQDEEQGDLLDTGERQPRLPEAGAVRDTEQQTPLLTEEEPEFRLTSQVARRRSVQTTLFQDPQKLPFERRVDFAVVGAAKIARGAVTFEKFSEAMRRQFGDKLDGVDLTEVYELATARAAALQQFDPDDYFNFRRVSLSEAERLALKGHVVETIVRTGRVPKERITFAEIRDEAQLLHPDAVKHLREFQEAQRPYRAVRDAARHRINVLNREIVEMRKALEGMGEEEGLEQERAVQAKERDVRGLLDTWMRMRSEDGRNLAMHRMMADSADTWQDAAYWLSRAKRAMGLPHGVDLPAHVRRDLRKILDEGHRRVIEGGNVGESKQQLSLFMMRLEKTGWLEAIAILRKAGLLTGIKTHLRNIGGNISFQILEELSRAPAVLIDMVLALGTGTRTVQGIDVRGVMLSAHQAATKGLAEAKEVMRHGATADEMMKMGAHRELNTGVVALDLYGNTVFRSLSASDRVFKSYAFRRALEEMAALEAINRGVSPVELLAKPTALMLAEATAAAEFATFNNENVVAKAFRSAQAVARRHSRAGRFVSFVGDILVPFANTPANIIARMFDYTPIAAVRAGWAVGEVGVAAWKGTLDKAMAVQQQRIFSQAVARGMVGTAFMYLGYQLAAAGLMSGGPGDEDPADRAVRESAGRMPGAVLVGGKWRQINALSPVGNVMTIGASLYRMSTKGLADEAKRPAKILAVGTSIVLEQPMLRGMSGLLEALENPGAMGEYFMASQAGSFVPTLISDLAGAFDPYRRDARPEGLRESLWIGVQSRVPGLRNLLPERRDVFGRDLPQSKQALWDPFIGSPARELDDAVVRELVRLDVGVGWPQRKGGETAEQYRERTRTIGQAIERNVATVIRSHNYREASDENRALMLDRTIDRTRARFRSR